MKAATSSNEMAPRIGTDLQQHLSKTEHPSLIAYLKVFIVSCLLWQKIYQSPIKSYKAPTSSKIRVSFRCGFFPKSSTAQHHHHHHPQVGVPGSLLGRQRHPEVDLALLMAILGIAVQLPRLPDDVAMNNPTSGSGNGVIHQVVFQIK